MEIPAEIVKKISNYEEKKKRVVLFMLLSTFPNENILTPCELEYKGEIIGTYYYQLEPVFLLLHYLEIVPSEVVFLCTKDTLSEKEFVCEGKKIINSEKGYIESWIKERWPDTKCHEIVDEGKEVDTINKVLTELRNINNVSDMNLIMDIHGGRRNLQMMTQGIITLLRYEKIIPWEVYTVLFDKTKARGEIMPANSTYDVNQYVAGMNEFLSYGRSNTLEEYYKDKDSELVKIIREISDSIQLCHILKFDEAIKRMGDYINDRRNNKDKKKDDYSDLFINTIEKAYGELIDSKGRNKVINKVKWCVDNDFIQQALTIIESRMPNELLQRNIIAYDYDYYDEKKVKLFYEGKNGKLNEIPGGVDLMSAIEYGKPEWESTINNLLIPWMRKNCCIEVWNEKRHRIDYIGRLVIEGTEIDKYVNYNVDGLDLSKKYKKIVDQNKNVIEIGFKINGMLDDEGVRNLIRFFMLHLELKDQRNVSNHANSKQRAGVDEVKTAIYAYIILMKKIFVSIGK